MRQNVGALPLAAFLVLLATLAVQKSPVTLEAPFLLALLNTLFVGISPIPRPRVTRASPMLAVNWHHWLL
jgi:hypothetical protein